VNQNVSDFMEFEPLDLRNPPKIWLIPKTWIMVLRRVTFFFFFFFFLFFFFFKKNKNKNSVFSTKGCSFEVVYPFYPKVRQFLKFSEPVRS
jgi:hypothetical protein